MGNEEFRSIKTQLKAIAEKDIISMRDVACINELLPRIAVIAPSKLIRVKADKFAKKIPSMRREYLNLDAGDEPFMEMDWDYRGIKEELKLFLSYCSIKL